MVENNTQDNKSAVANKTDVLRLETKAPLVLDKKAKTKNMDTIQPNRKSLWLGLVLSIIPGLGHFYAGYAKIGLLASLWMFAVFVSGAVVFFYGMNFLQGAFFSFAVLGLAGLWLIGYVITFLDIFRRCVFVQKHSTPVTNSPVVWYTFLLASVTTFVLFLYMPNFYISQAQDNAMLPIIGKGDYYIYNFDTSEPRHGEIVMFVNPVPNAGGDTKPLRVMAHEREQIKVENEVVYINGKPLLRTGNPLGTVLLDTTDGKASVFLERFNDGATLRSYEVLELTNIAPFDNSRTYFVPPESLFLMGDNRDASLDSRMTQEFGFLPISSVIGRPVMVIYSADANRNGNAFR